MKAFCYSIPFFITLSLTAFSQSNVPAEAEPSASSSQHEDDGSFWSMPRKDELYTEFSLTHLAAHKFNGWGASLRLGRFLNGDDALEDGNKGHAVELEINLFRETAHSTSKTYIYNNETGEINFAVADPSEIPAVTVIQNRKVTVDMLPIMLNYRYHGTMAGAFDWNWMNDMRWYLGAGIGFNIFYYKDAAYNNIYDSSGNLASVGGRTHRRFRLMPAAQLFGGFGYQISEKTEILLGIRGFFTDDKKFGANSNTCLKAGKIHMVCDLGVNWQW